MHKLFFCVFVPSGTGHKVQGGGGVLHFNED